jgi:hypothetical protein
VAPSVADALLLNQFRSTFGLPITPVVPIVPLVPQGDFNTAATVDSQAVQAQAALQGQVAPTADAAPMVVTPEDAQISGRVRASDRRTVTPREPPPELIDQGGVATATAYPARNLTSPGDPEEVALPPAASRTIEIPTPTPQARPAAYVSWQGYWWTHNPQSGWHYWDGSRWSHFAQTPN